MDFQFIFVRDKIYGIILKTKNRMNLFLVLENCAEVRKFGQNSIASCVLFGVIVK